MLEYRKSAVHPSDLELRSLNATAEANRCRREVAEIEAQLRAGHPDVEGLCRALADWSGELALLSTPRRTRNIDTAKAELNRQRSAPPEAPHSPDI
jgi:hypothetical protein